MSDIDKINEQIKQLSKNKFDDEKSFDNEKLKVIKDIKTDEVTEKTIKLNKIDEVEENTMKLKKIDNISKKIVEDNEELDTTREFDDSLTKKISKMSTKDDTTYDTTTGIFSNEMDEPLIKRAVLFGICIFTILIILLIIIIILWGDIIKDIAINTQSSIKIGNIYFDPFKISESIHDASIIFITHTHYDHFDLESINNIRNDNTYLVIVDDEDSIKKLSFTEEKIIRVKPNNTYKVLDYEFSTIPSYNKNKTFHLREYNWVGYKVLIDNEYYYVMGDTDDIDEAHQVKCDYLFIPIGGYYTMDYKEASNCTNIIKPKEVFPIHYGSIVGDISLGEKFKELISENIKVNILIK